MGRLSQADGNHDELRAAKASVTVSRDWSSTNKDEGLSLRVLVADDDPVSCEALKGLLTDWGYEVVTASNGLAALQILQAEDGPCLAVLDWMMPELNGTEICQRIRASRNPRYIFIILVTGRDQRKDMVEGYGSGADDYITKPVEPLVLRARLDTGSRIVVQKALRESEARFHSAFECAGVGMALVGTSGHWLQVNRALCDFLGYTPEELLATSFQKITHPGDLAGDLRALAALQSGSLETYQTEKRYIHKQGHSVWALVTVSAVPHADGSRSCFVSQIQDISERKNVENALRAAHFESELFINSVPSILIGTDTRAHVTRWNLAAANTFGLPESAVRGKPLKDCGIKWLHSDMEGGIAAWLKCDRSMRRDDLPFQKDGGRHFLGLTISRVNFPDQTSSGLLITGADTTERKNLEVQLRQAQKLEAIGQLAAGIAHEINTPTQFVNDNTTFLKESWPAIDGILRASQAVNTECAAGKVSAETLAGLANCMTEASDLEYLLAEVPRAIEQSLDGLQRVAKIVRAMKEFSHPGAEDKHVLDINRAIETTVTVARNEWKYVAEVKTDFDTTLPMVPCLAGEFNQVILNLLINAAHAIRDVVGDGSKGKAPSPSRQNGKTNGQKSKFRIPGLEYRKRFVAAFSNRFLPLKKSAREPDKVWPWPTP